MRKPILVAALSAAVLVAACASMMEDKSMSFFITSANPGQGGKLGGLPGADAWCRQLANAAGAGNKTWRAYLSTDNPPVNARDRIGNGPWYNANGVMIAANLDELHGAANKIDKTTGLNEKGGVINGFGDTPLMHDIMTGSTPDGRVAAGTTCQDWTASSGNTATVGHHDRKGTNPDPVANASWNSSHKTAGCAPAELARSGSAGLLYCFAVR
jgi:hypothetical protein